MKVSSSNGMHPWATKGQATQFPMSSNNDSTIILFRWNLLNLEKEDVKHNSFGGGIYLPQIAKP
jgi:hypothetical protein